MNNNYKSLWSVIIICCSILGGCALLPTKFSLKEMVLNNDLTDWRNNLGDPSGRILYSDSTIFALEDKDGIDFENSFIFYKNGVAIKYYKYFGLYRIDGDTLITRFYCDNPYSSDFHKGSLDLKWMILSPRKLKLLSNIDEYGNQADLIAIDFPSPIMNMSIEAMYSKSWLPEAYGSNIDSLFLFINKSSDCLSNE